MTADYVHIEETTVSDLWRLAARYRFPRRLNGGHSASNARSSKQSRLGRDFDGYVPYRTGEDVRHVDWPLYARTGGLYVRRYQDEDTGRYLLLLDCSGSMSVLGGKKWVWAKHLATLIGFVALRSGHEIELAICVNGRVRRGQTLSGTDAAHELVAMLNSFEPTGACRLDSAFRGTSAMSSIRQVFILSDMLMTETGESDLEWLAPFAQKSMVVRLLGPQELMPVEGLSSNPERQQDIHLGRSDVLRLKEQIDAYETRLHRALRRHSIPLVNVDLTSRLEREVAEVFTRLSRRTVNTMVL